MNLQIKKNIMQMFFFITTCIKRASFYYESYMHKLFPEENSLIRPN